MPYNTDASPSALGYLFQCRLALLSGIRAYKVAPALDLSIERFDDIVFENASGINSSIQVKHHIKPGDLTDMGVDLWKTLGIWMQRLKDNPTAFLGAQFMIVTTATAVNGSTAALLRSGRTEDNITDAAAKLLVSANTSTNQVTDHARQTFANLSPIERTTLLRQVFVYDNSPNIVNVRAEIEDLCWTAAPEGKISTFVDYLEGWWFSRVIASLATPNGHSIPKRGAARSVNCFRTL